MSLPSGETAKIEQTAQQNGQANKEISLAVLLSLLGARWRLLVFGPLIAGLTAFGVTFLIPPTYTARTVFLPPQQQQTGSAAALASLGALAGLAAGSAGLKSPADQYVALMQSVTVADRIIDKFKLLEVYDEKFRTDARKQLDREVRIAAGKKDGLISVEVDDRDPDRAAQMANQYVEELRRLTSVLAVSEAQQRRAFFERELKQTRDKLTAAQQAMQASGFSPGALKAEPKAAADSYARLRAEVTAAEVRVMTLRSSRAEQAPELQQAKATLAALRSELARSEQVTQTPGDSDYVGKYREFKYQETLFDLFARQYELARVDESREGALIQTVDKATTPERKSKPRRVMTAAVVTLISLLALVGLSLMPHFNGGLRTANDHRDMR
jgi:capsule polysaccharide export protein KpsE/RkpR